MDLTQAQIGDHLGLSQQQTSLWLARLGLSVDSGLDAVRLAYIDALRRAAAAQAPSEDRERLLRAKRELAEIEVRRETGELVLAGEVEAEMRDIFGTLKEGIERIAARKAAILAAESDPVKVARILSEEFRAAFADCSQKLTARAGEAPR